MSLFAQIRIYCFALFHLQALLHACIACSSKPMIDWIAASDLEDDSANLVRNSTVPLCNHFYLRVFHLCLIVLMLFMLQTPEAHAAAWKTLEVITTHCIFCHHHSFIRKVIMLETIVY